MAREKAKEVTDFSVEDKLRNLYSLQTMLSEIDKIKTLRGELPLEVEDLEDEIEGLTTRVEKINGEIDALKKEVVERQGNIEVNKANIERYKSQVTSVRNNREFDNLSKQIENAEMDNVLNEKRIKEAKAALEAGADLTREEIVNETRAEEEKLREKAKNLEMTIEPRLLNAYKRIRRNSRNGLGVVYVQRDACGGCFNKIPPQRQLDIRMRKKIIVCEYCGRIMVDPELAGVTVAPKVEEKKRRRSVRRKTEE